MKRLQKVGRRIALTAAEELSIYPLTVEKQSKLKDQVRS
jgi:hypothetical protein